MASPAPSSVRRRRASRLFRILLALAMVLVLRFVFVYALRYLSWDPAVFGEAFWPRRYALGLHLIGGVVAILTGLIQLWLGETRRAMAWHRALGLTYVTAVTIGAAGGYYLAVTAGSEGWVYASGLVGLSTAWALTTAMAYVAIRRRLIDLHRDWMIRSYVVTMAFVFFRLFDELGARAGLADAGERAKAAAWLCWAVPLLLAEPVLQWRRFRRPVLRSTPDAGA